jgi:hypothetical protein
LPTIWCAISGHGYGHAAQVVPVLNELGKLVSGLEAILRTTVPASFFQDRLTIPWILQSVQQDVGCVQEGPLQINAPATWEAHTRFHAGWEQRIKQEVVAMQSASPRLILANTPYLVECAGKEAGIPVVGLANFTWDEVLEPFADPEQPHQQEILATIRQSYAYADLALRIAPGLALPLFQKVLDIGPIAEPAVTRRDELRAHLGLAEPERLVLVGFGGIPLKSLPWDQMNHIQGYRFLIDGLPARTSPHIHSLSTIPFSFKTVLTSVDVVMTKPGYGTIVEAVVLGLPVIYVRRYNFADETPLVDFLHRYGRSAELSLADFASGHWQPTFEALRHTRTAAKPQPCTGASEAAQHLARYF